MARYIDESDIYKLFEESNGIVKLHVAQIDELPRADVVEVVRCSECKYSPNYKRAKGMVWCRKFREDVRSDGFCSYGERKTT